MMANDNSHLSLDFLRNLLQYASHGDLRPVDKYCRVKRSNLTNIDQQLLPTNEVCRGLLQKIDSRDSVVHSYSEGILRVLLLISPEYETPWMAVNVLIECLHSQSGDFGSSTSVMYSGLAYAQTFIQRTITSLWKIDQVEFATINSGASASTPRKWLLQIAQTATRPIFKLDGFFNNDNADNRHLILPMDLIVTIISLCRELEGPTSTISAAILDNLFVFNIRKKMVLPLLKLTNDLQMHLRNVDWQLLYKIIEEALKEKSLPLADLPGIAESIISLSSENHDWRQLLLFLFEASSSDLSTYSTISNVIQSTLSSKSTRELYSWYSIEMPKSVKKWVIVNYFLLLFEAARSSGSQLAAQLLGEALLNKDPAFDILTSCSQSLLRLCFPPHMFSTKKTSNEIVLRIFDELSYEGRGEFTQSGQPLHNFNLAILCQSLYSGSTQLEQRTYRFVAAERAQIWIHIATSLLTKGISNSMAAIFIIIVIFCEVPVSRHTLVRTMVASGKSLEMTDCIVVLALTRSLPPEELATLGPICKYFSSNKLPFNIFQKLADALSSICFGRTAILSASQKNMYLSRAPWWYRAENGNSADNKEILQSALYGLCVLLKDWDDMSWIAWKYLSDFIVLNKPSLPMVLRSWLYGELYTIARNQNFPAPVMEHILRALLVRLLLYFDVVDSQLVFAPSRALTSFGSSRGKVVNDDLVSLLEATIEITLQLLREVAIGSDKLEECQRQLQAICLDPKKAVTDVSINDGLLLKYKLPMTLLAGSFLFLHETKSGIKIISEACTTRKYIIILADTLIAEEKETFDGSPASAQGDLPGWLSKSGDNSFTNNSETSKVLYAPVCDLAIHCLSTSLGTMMEEEHTNLAQSLLIVNSTKEKLDALTVDSISSLNVLYHSIMGTMTFLLKVLPVESMSTKMNRADIDILLGLLEATCKKVTIYVTETSKKYSPVEIHSSCDLFSLLVKTSVLYEKIFNGKRIVLLIRLIKREKEREKSVLKQAPESSIISREEDIDAIIRGLRTNVLQSIVDCLTVPFIIGSTDTLLAFQLAASSVTTASDDSIGVFKFIPNLIKVICKSLLEGLEGHSGGVTGAMFSLHITILENSLFMIQKGANQIEIQNAATLLNQVSNILNDILLEYSIEVQVLLKRTLRIVTKLLPALYRLNTKIYAGFPRECGYPGAKLLRILRKEVLSRHSRGRGIVNEKPSRRENELEDKHEKQGDSDSDEFWNVANYAGIPLEISIPEEASKSKTGIFFNSNLNVEEILNILFSSAESNFSDTVSVLNRNEMKVLMSYECKGSPYYECRRDDLSECIRFICQFFKHFEKLEEKIMAKFTRLVDKLLTIFTKSVRMLHVSIESDNLATRASLEAICVLSAWALEENASFLSILDGWFLAEQDESGEAAIARYHIGGLGKKMRKIVLRLNDLENVLQKLSDAVMTWRATKGSISHIRFEDVGKLLRSKLKLVSSYQGQKNGTYADSFVERQLTLATKSRSAFDNVLVATSINKRKANNDLAERVRRERKRPVPRSRNPVVDQWLQIDDDLVDDADGDAYVDLEDFVVEG
mmetsp:Transcript_14653/g.22593  ORF Transcript_14653/g.22593 Transcript_14653/m.22593 type:complete len:1563 (+) Transcript_14653:88-4776(+)